MAAFTNFCDNSDAGTDPLNPAKIVTNDGGQTFFNNNSDGGTAQFITVGTGFVDFSGSLGPNGDGRINAGSIEGTGIYYIGAGNTLVVGGNIFSTTLKGVDCRLQSSAGVRLSANSRHRQFQKKSAPPARRAGVARDRIGQRGKSRIGHMSRSAWLAPQPHPQRRPADGTRWPGPAMPPARRSRR